MARLRMIDVGLPYKKIMRGSKWVGRVYKAADGTYTGCIGKAPNRTEVTGNATERQAFDEVGARYFGQPNAAALAAHNSSVRASNRVSRQHRRSMVDEMLAAIGRTIGGQRATATMRRISSDAVAVTVERGEDDFMPPVVPPRGRQH